MDWKRSRSTSSSTATSSSPSTARRLAAESCPNYSPEGRSEQYVVYVVLDAMVATAFDALSATELALEGLQVLRRRGRQRRGCGRGRCGRSTCG